MPTSRLPHILIVDDEDTAQYVVGLNTLAETRARHPRDVALDDLEWADLVLMDFIISNWSERDELDQVSLQPPNGLALAAVLREHADATNDGGPPYTAFAIHSAHIGDISKRLHTTNRTPHVVARLNNLEWAFDKADPTRFDSCAALADAVRQVSVSFASIESGRIPEAVSSLLKLGKDAIWSERATDDVVLSQIPLSEFSAGTNGLLFLRWILHGILPYPTFLLPLHWVAVRLRITPKSLRCVLDDNSELTMELAACRYDGLLASFNGPRWWRASIDQYVWGLRASGARDPDAFHTELEKRSGISLERVNTASPAVCVDRDLKALDDVSELESVVRLVPDLWPPYADSAYADVAAVRCDAELRSIVHPLDRERVLVSDEDPP